MRSRLALVSLLLLAAACAEVGRPPGGPVDDVPPELGRHVVTTGRRLYVDDREADHAFVRDVQLRAADVVEREEG